MITSQRLVRSRDTRRVTAEPVPDRIGSGRMIAWIDAALSRIGLRTPTARDTAAAVGLTVVSLVAVLPALGPLASTFGVHLSDAQRLAIVVVVLLQTAVLGVRRRATILCLGLVTVGQVALAVLLPADATLRAAAPFVAAYTAGTLLSPVPLAAVIAGSVVVDVVGGHLASLTLGGPVNEALGVPTPSATADPLQTLARGPVVLLSTVAAAAVGAWIAARRAQLLSAQARADAAVQQQRERIDTALARERVRMARELHDIAAHHLSGLIVAASAAERLIDRDPPAAKDTIRSLRRQGRQALDNLRVAVGVLRDTGDPGEGHRDDTGAPVPGLAVIDDLVASARAVGDDLELSVLGEPVTLPPVADTAAYRVAQEAIANARRHAPGAPVRVVLDHREHGVRLEIVNGPGAQRAVAAAADPGGFGLVGMRERAALLGARLETGPTRDGGWRVLLEMPGQEAVR